MSDQALQQRRNALKKADRVRFAKAERKAQLRRMSRTAAAVYAAKMALENDEIAARFTLRELVTSCPGFGPEKLRQLCRAISAQPVLRLGDLSEQQREMVARFFVDRRVPQYLRRRAA